MEESLEDAEATVVRRVPDAPDIPGYEIYRELGRGGMGVVYQGREKQQIGDREVFLDVAIKTVLLEYAEDQYFVQRFLDEAERHIGMSHPNIVRVYRAAQTDDCLYLVLQFAGDGSLRDQLDDGKVDIDRASRIIKRVAEGLAYAHEEGVLHMDIKPDNILFSGDTPLISDFGVARSSRMSGSHASVVAGDPRYWAPEQQEGQPCEKSDVFSLGVTFFELLCGKRPSQALRVIGSKAERDLLLKELPPPARKFGKLIADCLHEDLDQRPTALELSDRIRQLVKPPVPIGTFAILLLCVAASVYLATNRDVRLWLEETWYTVFPASSYTVQVEVFPANAEVWVNDQQISAGANEIANGTHQVYVVANGFVGRVEAFTPTRDEQELTVALAAMEEVEDAEYLEWFMNFGGSEDEMDALLSKGWNDPTLRNLVLLENAERAGDLPLQEAIVDEWERLAAVGDNIAQTSLFYAAMEGLPIVKDRYVYAEGLVQASDEGYPLAKSLQALHVMQAMLERGSTFVEDTAAQIEFVRLLRDVHYAGLEQTADTLSRAAGLELNP